MTVKPAILLAVWSAAMPAIAADLPQPLIRIADLDLPASPVIIAYGDTRFTDPLNVTATNPKVRRWLVDRIAQEKPDLLLVSGDLPWNGGDTNDYAVFHAETAVWRAEHLLIAPALGNHEFHGEVNRCLENWWNEFPILRGKRWYSVALGARVFVLNLDSDSSLLPASDQITWIKAQLDNLPPSVQFVFLNLHHPPVADVQAAPDDDHNPRPNEIALANFLKDAHSRTPVRFIVSAGHIHNYERFLQNGITYLVDGGGGAKPRPVVRESNDLYRDEAFPNYCYVKFKLQEHKLEAEMIRVRDASADAPRWDVKDRFEIPAP
jgi:acid phosphatase type 7